MAVAHYNLGNALYQSGQPEQAIAHLRKAIEFQPDNASAYNNLGGILLQKGSLEEASAQFEKTLQLNTNHVVARNNLGRARLQQQRPKEAGQQFQKALEFQPGFSQAADNLRQAIWALATSQDDKVRNGKQAVEFALTLGQYCPTNSPLYLGTLAAAYAEARQFSQAIECAGLARQLAPESTNSLARDLEAQLALYRAGMSLHDSDRTNSIAPSRP
jgi:tetratricopeptide (TPR) repeat protein